MLESAAEAIALQIGDRRTPDLPAFEGMEYRVEDGGYGLVSAVFPVLGQWNYYGTFQFLDESGLWVDVPGEFVSLVADESGVDCTASGPSVAFWVGDGSQLQKRLGALLECFSRVMEEVMPEKKKDDKKDKTRILITEDGSLSAFGLKDRTAEQAEQVIKESTKGH
jgi:hypothetical protein